MSDKLKPILIFVSFLLLYSLCRSSQLDVTEAIALEQHALYSPNHMLSRPIATVAWKILQTAGYSGRSLYVLRILNVIYGAIGVAIAFVAFQRLGATSWAALAGSILLGTSYIYWHQSTDAYYIVLSGMFTAAALLCSAILIQRPSLLTAFFLGVCFACATLSWQAAALLFPVFIWPLRHRFKEVMNFVIIFLGILVSVYIAVGTAQGYKTAGELFYWITHHGGGNIPWWGKFGIDRIPLAAISAIQSIQVFAISLRAFSHSPNQWQAWAFSTGSLCFLLLVILILIRGIQITAHRNWKLIWLLSGYMCIFAFLVWWEPLDLKNFVVPNIFLCGIAALVFSSWKPTVLKQILLFSAIAVLALLTFRFLIWPRHIDRGISMRKAECVHRNVTSKDAVITTDWNFITELLYFYRMRTIEIVALSAYFHDHGKLMEHVYSELEKTQNNGGRIFIVDPNSYSADYLKWLAEQTTFTPADFGRFPGKFAFQCEDLKFREVTALER